MSFSRVISRVVVVFVITGAAFAADAPAASAPAILPENFAGWQANEPAKTSRDPAAADPTNASILKEYGFSDLSSVSYVRDDGRTVKIRAARFEDASGAFGAYTFYLQPDMTSERIGDQGASLGQRVLFYRGHILVDASFSKETPMSGSELRELAGMLPRPSGNAGNLPPMLAFMPRRGYIANTEKYALGPAALAVLAPPLSSDLVDFNAKPEVTLGRYKTSNGEATLMLIYYPTPQLAGEHLRRIDAVRHSTDVQSENAAGENAKFYDKRTGPIIAIAAGAISSSDAKSLLGLVNYEANVTWNENTYFDKNNNIGSLLVNIILLCFILGAMAIVAGVAFGGIRILMKRLFPDKIFDRPEQMEFISLHLAESVPAGSARAPESGEPTSNSR
jgi:hypothetical protein